MRLLIICLLLLGFCPLVPATTMADQEAIGLQEIEFQDIHLEMDDTDAEVLFRKDPHDKSKFPVRVRDGEQWLSGSIEVKGSFTRNFIKKSLLIKLEKGQEWHGYRKISLNSMVTDPASMREWLVWDLVDRLGVPHPQVKYTRMYINGHFIGLFLFIEWIEPPMFENFGAGADGEFYHPIDSKFCGDMSLANLPRLPECWYKLAPQDQDFSTLQKLVKGIAATPAETFDLFLERNFDIDSLLNWILVNTLVSSVDTYNKNYFLYFSRKTGKWLVVPWDYDLSFGRVHDHRLPFLKNILNDNFQYFYSPELGNSNPLKEKTLSNPQLLKRFRAHLRHVFGLRNEGLPEAAFGWFRPSRFAARIDQLERTIRADLQQDHYNLVPDAEFARHVETLKFYNLMRFHLLKDLVLTPSLFNTPRWMPFSSYPKFTADEVVEAVNVSPFPPERTYLPLVLASTVSLQPGQKQVVPVDEQLARPLGILNVHELDRVARVRLEVEMEHRPAALPPGVDNPEQCIQRNWYLDIKTPDAKVSLGLVLDYLQENSSHHELGALVNEENEHRLQLWLRYNKTWMQLSTHNNTLTNTFTTRPITIRPGLLVHFVACLPANVKN